MSYDIKLTNILFEKAVSRAPTARFLWAPCGLQDSFDNITNGKAVIKYPFFPRYAAPEALAMNQTEDHLPQNINGDSRDPNKEYAKYLKGSQHISLCQWKSTAIFSFGCVILEVLSVLVGEGHPIYDTHEFQSLVPFGANVSKMHAWIENQVTKLNKEQEGLEVIFRLGMQMTQADPETRPLIGEIVEKLTAAGREYFCAQCFSQSEDSIAKRDKARLQEAETNRSNRHFDTRAQQTRYVGSTGH